MDISFKTGHHRSQYQDLVHKMVAPFGKNLKPASLHNKTHSKCPNNPLRGTLRKRTKRLQERVHGMQDSRNTPGYRVPGSMTK